MIYIKLNNKYYKQEEINLIDPFFMKYYHIKAYLKILNQEINKTLKNYPDIEIILHFKKKTYIFGRFFKKNSYKKTYPITENPFIVLYPQSLVYTRFNVIAFKKTLLHEFYHFKQWIDNTIDNKKHNHNKLLPATTNILNKKEVYSNYNNLKRVI